uniref:Pentatricopeptide repeat-containing protein n=1 Tax=Oryza glumipatula TaxID=40148 RepID=A0A0D9Y2L8_9ORYZ
MAVVAPPFLTLPQPPQNPTPKPHRRPPRDIASWTSAIARPVMQVDLPAVAAALSARLSSPAAPAPQRRHPFHHPLRLRRLPVLRARLPPCAPRPRPRAQALPLPPPPALRVSTLRPACLTSPSSSLTLRPSAVTYNTVISGLMRNDLVAAAFEVFDGMPAPDKVSWFIDWRHDEVINCFHAMLLDSVDPDYVMLIAVISTCAEVGALGLEMWVHWLVVRQGLERNFRIASSLIDMYAWCGQVELARPFTSATTWNSRGGARMFFLGGGERRGMPPARLAVDDENRAAICVLSTILPRRLEGQQPVAAIAVEVEAAIAVERGRADGGFGADGWGGRSGSRSCARDEHDCGGGGATTKVGRRWQRPLLRYECAAQSKKGEDFFLLRTDCARPSTSSSSSSSSASSPPHTFVVFAVSPPRRRDLAFWVSLLPEHEQDAEKRRKREGRRRRRKKMDGKCEKWHGSNFIKF